MSRACELLGISRSWYYQRPAHRAAAEVALQDEIERIVVEFSGYGYRRVTHELARRGWVVNHKRVLRVMRENSWLCRLCRMRRRTTLSDHNLLVYPNLLPQTEITGLNPGASVLTKQCMTGCTLGVGAVRRASVGSAGGW